MSSGARRGGVFAPLLVLAMAMVRARPARSLALPMGDGTLPTLYSVIISVHAVILLVECLVHLRFVSLIVLFGW
jgi:hypothetical protein